MLIRQLPRLGRRVVSEWRHGQASSFPRHTHSLTRYRETPQTHCWQYVKHSFSTSTEDRDSGNQQKEKEMISVTFVDKDGEEKQVKVPVGMSILEAAHANDIDLEGACEASLACSTCHVIVMDTEFYNKLDEPVDEENDMLDLAFGLTETSRLGCQIIAKPELDGIRLAIPAATRNFAVDGYVPKPH
ncbi:unnamed protein product [Victoria cruziana]